MKVAMGHVHNSRGKSSAPSSLWQPRQILKITTNWLTMDSIVSSGVHFRCQDRSNGQPASQPTVLQISLNPGSYVSQTFIIEIRFLFYSGVLGSFFHTRTTLELDFFVKGWLSATHWMLDKYNQYTWMDALPCDI